MSETLLLYNSHTYSYWLGKMILFYFTLVLRYLRQVQWNHSSMVLYGIRAPHNRTFPYMEATYPLCHKEPARSKQSLLLGALERKIENTHLWGHGGYFACFSKVLYGIRDMWFPARQGPILGRPYALKNQTEQFLWSFLEIEVDQYETFYSGCLMRGKHS